MRSSSPFLPSASPELWSDPEGEFSSEDDGGGSEDDENNEEFEYHQDIKHNDGDEDEDDDDRDKNQADHCNINDSEQGTRKNNSKREDRSVVETKIWNRKKLVKVYEGSRIQKASQQ